MEKIHMEKHRNNRVVYVRLEQEERFWMAMLVRTQLRKEKPLRAFRTKKS